MLLTMICNPPHDAAPEQLNLYAQAGRCLDATMYGRDCSVSEHNAGNWCARCQTMLRNGYVLRGPDHGVLLSQLLLSDHAAAQAILEERGYPVAGRSIAQALRHALAGTEDPVMSCDCPICRAGPEPIRQAIACEQPKQER